MQVEKYKVIMKMNSKDRWLLCLPLALFLLAFLAVPISQMHGLKMMPGDIGDARLNNYFLENIYQFITGHSASLWHLGFFSPFPYVLGFSDNLFGSSPVYLLARFLTGQADTAFQFWFFIGYGTNFVAAYYALRRLGGSTLASSIGALIFSFALPTSAHAGHAQLHYRFGIPLTITFFFLFLDRKEFHLLTAAGAWLAWQFYCGVYMGFFTLLFTSVATVIYFLYNRYMMNASFAQSTRDFTTQWILQSRNEKLKILFYLTVLLAAMVLLFYPYLQVSHLYGVKRSWGEIASMLPRLQSYFLSDASYFWSAPASKVFSGIPMRHEHQMFIGAIPMMLAVLGFIIGNHKKNGQTYTLMSGMLGVMIVLTLYVGGLSLWILLYKLPLASAIRAMARLDQVMLFPVAYLAVVAIDQLCEREQWVSKVVCVIVLPLLIFEFSATSMGVSAKDDWRRRLAEKEFTVPDKLNEKDILFFAQNKGPFFADEIDSMWVGLHHGVATLNGYSGIFPPGYTVEFGNDCTELPKRILSYLSFTRQQDDVDAYKNIIRRVVPVGFVGCDENWFITPPPISTVAREYSNDEIRQLSYLLVNKSMKDEQWTVEFKIVNAGDLPISSSSSISKPMRLSWRFVDSSGKPASGWEKRKDLPFDIPAKGALNIRLRIDPNMEIRGGALQISLVQDGVFWAHDIGVKPLEIPWEMPL